MTNASLKLGLTILAAVHLAAIFAGTLAPYDPSRQHREFPRTPPSRIWFENGTLLTQPAPQAEPRPIRFFRWNSEGFHLFEAEEPGFVFLLGTDGLGRDQFSRLLHGSRLSLLSGIAAAAISALTGALLGGFAGYFGGRVDRVIMGAAEVFLALPWMYLLLAARAFFPLNTEASVVFFSLLALLGFAGWATPGRLVRGILQVERQREYVLAARSFGASPLYLLRKHLLPQAIPSLAAYLSLAIPRYVLAETSMSFVGLGLSGGATPSWGSLLSLLSQVEVFITDWWIALPAFAVAVVFAAYAAVARSLAQSAESV